MIMGVLTIMYIALDHFTKVVVLGPNPNLDLALRNTGS